MTALKRGSDLLTLVVFAAAMYVPFAGWWLHLDANAEFRENRTLHQLPALPHTGDELLALPKSVDAFWNDQFGFRPRLIKWNALIKLRSGVSPSPSVVVGNHGRLFFTGDSSMEAFKGKTPFSPQELAYYRVELEARQAWLASKGIKYLLLVAPNKESVYPEDVPEEIPYAQPHRLDQLIETLKGSPLQVLDLRPALIAQKEKDSAPLFHDTDTHWTDVGAFAGYQLIRDRLKEWFPQQIQGRTWADFQRVDGPAFSGDLSAMVALVGYLENDRLELVPTPPFRSRELTGRAYNKGGPPIAKWEGKPGGPRLVLFHDSFFLDPPRPNEPVEHVKPFAMVPLIAEDFSYTYSQWRHDFGADVAALIEREKPDVVIQEMVERSLINGLPGVSPRPPPPAPPELLAQPPPQ